MPRRNPASTPTVAAWIPAPTSGFVGRQREIAELARCLQTMPLVSLTGPPGIGKTRLAKEVAARVAPSFPDGVWLLALVPVAEPALVPQTVAIAMGLPPEPSRDPMDAVLAHLQGRRALVVLDNCEQVRQACATVAQRILDESARIPILTTSQQPLGLPAEHVMPLSAMSLPDPGSRV